MSWILRVVMGLRQRAQQHIRDTGEPRIVVPRNAAEKSKKVPGLSRIWRARMCAAEKAVPEPRRTAIGFAGMASCRVRGGDIENARS